MNRNTEDFLVQAWKQQLDAGLRVIETLVEGATKLHEVQIEAAADAHADAVATHKAIAAAADLPQLLKLQAEWSRANTAKCGAYWRDLFGVVVETQAALARGVGATQFYKLPAVPAQPKAEKRAA